MNKLNFYIMEFLFVIVLIAIFSSSYETLKDITAIVMFFVYFSVLKCASYMAFILLTFDSKNTKHELEERKKTFKKIKVPPMSFHLVILSLNAYLFSIMYSSDYIFMSYYVFISYISYIAIARSFVSKLNDFYLINNEDL